VIRQKTIKKPVSIEGIGLQTGKKISVSLKPSPANSGINFIRTDLANKPLLNIQSLELGEAGLNERRTTLGAGPLEIQTTEHLLGALAGLSIDNIIVEMDGVELPGLDGSAKGFLEALKTAGMVEQDAARVFFEAENPLWCADDSAFLAVFPDKDFRISYVLSYRSPAIGTQFLSLMVDGNSFEREIAPARTFCLEEETIELLRRGLGKGADYENTLVMRSDGPVKNTLRFPDEPVRHKILDLMGDLYILGRSIKGHVIAIRSGHRLNLELVKRLKSEMAKR
jgi:UDP-3-O-acyl N-acetylglucosamine deacetylase